MIYLSCESSTLLGSVAISKDDQILSYIECERQGSHSDVIHGFIDQALKKANLSLNDIDYFCSGIGPGSFTGIRVSLNTIKSLAYSFNKPTLAIDSLKTLAWQYNEEKQVSIVSMINAYKNMVYISTYQKATDSTLSVVKEPEVVRVQNLENYLDKPSVVVGDGYLAYEKYFSASLKSKILRPQNPIDFPKADAVAILSFLNSSGAAHWSKILPIYLRASEAEENLKGIKYQPLS